ncbi:hypothetical protein VOLCADRAFT_90214 [Volvox carteri f. nagariensis]|uniref:GPI inositol-deacylase n=1 Tax=Volvox carteri f. nagariensis TaxID=3068 RepID=D8TTS8_VOLCA|nr:uncharacterized protein VOLCADRAFT_90214 [Volvox carteri f. nagariensis]EFJ48916.1 hypothetical protein VOLCADRAFT_90214 [Volvox carteri f. nagariensis]|eukprot:XP_002949813.1 hypothetical protein VOLCADRAFT_90214 [Volvox carteri f. nagariensis]
MKLAVLLATTAAMLAWCGVQLYHVLQSQQSCEMTYMYAKYAAVEMPPETAGLKVSSSGPNGSIEVSAVMMHTAAPTSPLPDWAKEFSTVANRVVVAVNNLRNSRYRLWRYTGDDQGAMWTHTPHGVINLPRRLLIHVALADNLPLYCGHANVRAASMTLNGVSYYKQRRLTVSPLAGKRLDCLLADGARRDLGSTCRMGKNVSWLNYKPQVLRAKICEREVLAKSIDEFRDKYIDTGDGDCVALPKPVRSLASETARRSSRLGVRFLDPVDVIWYMLDLEGEWSAFDGDILERHVKFTLAAMRHLAAIHNIITPSSGGAADTNTRSTTTAGSSGGRRPLQLHPGLVVVGHSMGGVVAADALARAAEDPELGPSLASLLVTLGSPHVRPPAPGHPSLQRFYTRAAARPRPVVPVVAIAGGAADVQLSLIAPAAAAATIAWRWHYLYALVGHSCQDCNRNAKAPACLSSCQALLVEHPPMPPGDRGIETCQGRKSFRWWKVAAALTDPEGLAPQTATYSPHHWRRGPAAPLHCPSAAAVVLHAFTVPGAARGYIPFSTSDYWWFFVMLIFCSPLGQLHCGFCCRHIPSPSVADPVVALRACGGGWFFPSCQAAGVPPATTVWCGATSLWWHLGRRSWNWHSRTAVNSAPHFVTSLMPHLCKDALPDLAAVRNAAAAATTSSRRLTHEEASDRSAAEAPAAWAAAHGLDAARIVTEGLSHDDAVVQPPNTGRSWDWALRRLDQHLAHPAQSYMAAATVAAAMPPSPGLRRQTRRAQGVGNDGHSSRVDGSGEGTGGIHGTKVDSEEMPERERNDLEGVGEAGPLLRLAQRALTPSADGGAACGGANLAWYLQYGDPQRLKPGEDGQATLRLLPSDLEGVPGWGRMYSWDLTDGTGPMGRRLGEEGPRGWAAVISGSNPCSAFRAWLSVTVDYGTVTGSPAAATAPGDQGSKLQEKLQTAARRALPARSRSVRHDVEVTGFAAPLPAVSAAGGWRTRLQSEWQLINQGREYQSRGGWLLLLPNSLVLPLLERTGTRNREQENATAGDGQEAVVEVQLTVWLAEPSYKPAFSFVAQTLAPVSGSGSDVAGHTSQRHPEPLRFCLPEVPMGRLVAMAGNLGKTWQAPPPPSRPLPPQQRRQLLVPLEVPYLTSSTYDNRAPNPVAGILRWLGLYKYTAVRITRLDADGQPVVELQRSGSSSGGRAWADARRADGGGSGGGRGAVQCFFPTVVLVGGGNCSSGTRMASLLRISTNRTLHSLEPCTTDPSGCSSVTAILDPACQYKLDLVPYMVERLGPLLLAHVGHLWLWAQLAALMAVAAAAEAVSRSTAVMAAIAREAPRPVVAGTVPSGPTSVVKRSSSDSVKEPAGGLSLRGRWRFWSWIMIPWDAVGVLQVWLPGQGGGRAPALFLITAAVATVATSLLLHTPSWPQPHLPSELPHKLQPANSADDNGFGEIWNLIQRLSTLTWPALRKTAQVAGLCPQPHLHNCGWSALSSRGIMGLGLLAPLAASLSQQMPLGLQGLLAPLLPDQPLVVLPEAAAGEFLSVLDRLALAATSTLLVWLIAAILQGAIAAVAIPAACAAACSKLLVWLLYSILYWPLMLVGRLHRIIKAPLMFLRRLVLWPKDRSCSTAAAAATTAWEAAVRRMMILLVPLAALTVLSGAPSAIPSLVLLVSVLNLAMSLSVGQVTPQPGPAAAASTAIQLESAASLQLAERRCYVAWLLYYATYGTCAAPAAAAALRCVVRRPGAVVDLFSAVAGVIAWVLERWWEGQGPQMVQSGVRGAHESMVRTAVAAHPHLVKLLSRPVQALAWGLETMYKGRGIEVLHDALHGPMSTAAPAVVAWPLSVGAAGYVLAAAHCMLLASQAAAGRPCSMLKLSKSKGAQWCGRCQEGGEGVLDSIVSTSASNMHSWNATIPS